MQAANLLVQLTKPQYDFCHSDATYRALTGGRGSGKSFCGAYDLLRRAEPKMLYGVYAPTFRMLQDATMRTFMHLATEMRYLKSFRRGDMLAVLGNEAEVMFRSLDDPERARGPNLSGAWIDEASVVPKEAFEIIIAALRQSGRMGWLSATFTPKGLAHWTYDVFGRGGPNVATFHTATSDNPFLPPEFMETVRAQYTEYLALQELQGEFIDPEGAMARREWFKTVPSAPQGMSVRFWDFAATKGSGDDPDYTVGTKMTKNGGTFYVTDVVRGRFSPGEIERIALGVAEKDGKIVSIGMEQEPGSAGKLFCAQMIKLLAGYHVRGIRSTGDKVQRAMPFLAQAEAGNVFLVDADWNRAWLDEITSVPHARHDDQWDSAAGAFNMLARGGWARRVQ